MKKTLIVLGATATLLAGILAPTTGFAAERSAAQPEIKNVKANASYEYIPSYIFVGSSFYFPSRYKHPSVWGFDNGVVSVDFLGKVTGLKNGTATIQVWDEEERETKTFWISVY
ncbi:hypothetical protein M3650_03790 [Paenibacillus sp. MER TA 81-3]|uniref:hypothetical protein n=1 Tax=Paenibacillus sp. MER TA 81-3 TaxID=2939573 RepID=UPI00203B0870|nr:hypothetical protein [Paenibacillus sp. MER TA 81-3]MCM3337778.1 hypothetical protein [Paenibacillus sp. MER TA 81-3]